MRNTEELRVDLLSRVMKFGGKYSNTKLALGIYDNRDIQDMFIKHNVNALRYAFESDIDIVDLLMISSALKVNRDMDLRLKDFLELYVNYKDLSDSLVEFIKCDIYVLQMYVKRFKQQPEEEVARVIINANITNTELDFVFETMVNMSKKTDRDITTMTTNGKVKFLITMINLFK